MRTTPVTIAVLLLLVLGIGIYFANTNTNTGTNVNTTGTSTPTSGTSTSVPTSTSTSTSTATSTPQNVTVDIRSFAYSPATLTIKRGTRVTWTNYDTAPHDVTSVSGSLLGSPRLTTGQSFSFTFTQPGTVNYYCTIHPNMRATVVVTE